MNIKKIKGISALFLIFALAINFASPLTVGAYDWQNDWDHDWNDDDDDDNGDDENGVEEADVDTSLTRGTAGSGDDNEDNPIVKAMWEMNDEEEDGNYVGSDDSNSSGAQFLPSGVYENNKRIAVCAVVTDPDGVDDIDSVYADTFYPENIYLGDDHPENREGCGDVMSEFTLNQLSKADGIELFCDRIRDDNTNLPTFNDDDGDFDYDEICAADGELQKETAFVYCGERDISYEDPSGEYRTLVLAQDNFGEDGTLENTFKYLPLTAFETDFDEVSYGSVKLNTHKIISGDLAWDNLNGGKASVRNVGNTRLAMKVWQDDMDLGMTDGDWNVEYDARVGSDADFAYYDPDELTTIDDPLDLSETNEMDFSIKISKFPPTHDGDEYDGDMTLCASSVAHLTCSD